MASSHWFILWPTSVECKEPPRSHSQYVIEKYGVRLYLHRTHSLYYCCSSESPFTRMFLNLILYLGKIDDSKIHEATITKEPTLIDKNLLSQLGNEDGSVAQSTIYVEPIAVMENLVEKVPKTAISVAMLQNIIKQPPYMFLVNS